MKIEIEDRNLHHVGVVVVAGEGLLFEELPLRGLQEPAVHAAAFQIGRFRVLSEDVRERGDEEARRTARRVADALPRLRVHKRDDEIDDVPRRAELAVRA